MRRSIASFCSGLAIPARGSCMWSDPSRAHLAWPADRLRRQSHFDARRSGRVRVRYRRFRSGARADDADHLAAQTKTDAHQPLGSHRTGVSAKDIALAMIAGIGAGGATGHAIEFAGAAIKALSMEGRLTLCNMSIEAGARCGMIAPDDTTFAYLKGRPYAPQGAHFDKRRRSMVLACDRRRCRVRSGGRASMPQTSPRS